MELNIEARSDPTQDAYRAEEVAACSVNGHNFDAVIR